MAYFLPSIMEDARMAVMVFQANVLTSQPLAYENAATAVTDAISGLKPAEHTPDRIISIRQMFGPVTWSCLL